MKDFFLLLGSITMKVIIHQKAVCRFFFFFPVIEKKKKENTLSGMTKHFPSTLHLKFRNTPVCRTHFCCLITLATFYYMKLNGWKITDNNVATPFLFS